MKSLFASIKNLRTRGGFFYLFLHLILIIILYPYLTGSILKIAILNGLFVGVMFTVLYAVARDQRHYRMAFILGFSWLLVSLVNKVVLAAWAREVSIVLLLAGVLLAIAFLAHTMYSLFYYILRSRQVTEDTIFAAISIYLLLGITWGIVYSFVEGIHPGSFYFSNALILGNEKPEWYHFLYYSFITLTTVGYGDVTPVTQQSQSLAILEAITGVLFTAVMIARLVGLYPPPIEKE